MFFLRFLVFLLTMQCTTPLYSMEELIEPEMICKHNPMIHINPFKKIKPSGFFIKRTLISSVFATNNFSSTYLNNHNPCFYVIMKKAATLCNNLLDSVVDLIDLEIFDHAFDTNINEETILETINEIKSSGYNYITKTESRKNFAMALNDLLIVVRIPKKHGCSSIDHTILCDQIEKQILEIQNFFEIPKRP